jgi:hypothetical protein
MFNRKYAARDRRKSRGFIAKEYMADIAAHRDERQSPLPDVGHDATDLGMIDDHLDEYYRRYISPELWARYTTVVPFCTVPSGGVDPNKGLKRRRIKGEVALLKSMSAESIAKLSDELPPVPTFAEQVAKAGGRPLMIEDLTSGPSSSELIRINNLLSAGAWHEQDGSI